MGGSGNCAHLDVLQQQVLIIIDNVHSSSMVYTCLILTHCSECSIKIGGVQCSHTRAPTHTHTHTPGCTPAAGPCHCLQHQAWPAAPHEPPQVRSSYRHTPAAASRHGSVPIRCPHASEGVGAWIGVRARARAHTHTHACVCTRARARTHTPADHVPSMTSCLMTSSRQNVRMYTHIHTHV